MPTVAEQQEAMQAAQAAKAAAAQTAARPAAAGGDLGSGMPAGGSAPAVMGGKPTEQPPRAAPGGRGGFSVLLASVQAQSFDSDKVSMIKGAAPSLRISCAELDQLLGELGFDSDKVEVAVVLRASVGDPQNAGSLMHHFSFDSDKAKVRGVYAR
jgi:hypothetical protein